MADSYESYPTLLISGLPPTITELDIVNVLNQVKMETKVIIERDAMTGAPRVKLVFRYQNDADRFFATVNGSMFLGSKVQLTFQDPNMNYSTTSGAKTIVAKHIPLGVTSLDFYDVARTFGKIISCKVMIDRSNVESYALLQFENQDHADRFLQDMNGANFRGGLIALSWQFHKNAPYVYPTNRSLPAQSTPRPSQAPIGPTNGGVQVAVGAGWSMTSPPSTPSTPPAMLGLSSSPSPRDRDSTYSSQRDSTHSSHRVSWQNYPTSPTSPVPNAPFAGYVNWNAPSPIRPGSTTGWHTGTSPTPDLSSTGMPPAGFVLLDRSATSPTPSTSATIGTTNAASPAPSTGSGTQTPQSTNRRSSSTSLTSAEAVAAGLDPRNLYVKNLDDNVDHQDLFGLFKAFGRIVSARVMKEDGGSGKSKGFGFVSFEEETQARAAIESLDGYRWGSKTLVVCVAEPKGFREKKLMALHGTGR
ncbi:hypothetical protein DFJ73DRAFT_872621 [Zopfochytrium polystomum]|nr:hypothetical protein DFJ73DRAFT_872621 [Zopfochytrium polystomum]